jgi:hypothetical protein
LCTPAITAGASMVIVPAFDADKRQELQKTATGKVLKAKLRREHAGHFLSISGT